MNEDKVKFKRGERTVQVWRSSDPSLKKVDIRCIYCGKKLGNQIGKVTSISEVAHIKTSNATENLCPGCNALFLVTQI